MLTFVHLSDIHFCKQAVPAYDLDAHLRNELELDAQRFRRDHGAPTALLISGDIAYNGQQSEYDLAISWLDKLCELVDCATPDAVWAVPGNHDVDRQVIRDDYNIGRCHGHLRSLAPHSIDAELKKYIDSKHDVLLSPLAAYNRFANKYDSWFRHDRPYWEEIFPLDHDWYLRIRGVNSVLISDEDDDDEANRLVLGKHQCQISRAQGIASVIMCHHPPDWLRDRNAVETSLNALAAVQLYGHKHAPQLIRIGDSVRVVAGAVHPHRADRAWSPRYNWLRFSVEEDTDVFTLVFEVWPRVWSDDEQRFVPDSNSCGGEEMKAYNLPLEGRPPPAARGQSEQPKTRVSMDSENTNQPSNGSEPIQMRDPERALAHRFLRLPFVERLILAQDLNLIANEDEGLDDDQELFRRIFNRAKESNVLGDLWDRIDNIDDDPRYPYNPFRR